MMENNWKANIGDYFSKKGIFRLKFLNTNLYRFCEEYVKYIEEFHGVYAKVSQEKVSMKDIMEICIYVNLDLLDSVREEQSGFLMNIHYNDSGRLNMKYSTKFRWGAKMQSVFTRSIENQDFHEYKEEELSEPEIFEKEYIFQLINQRLINYIEIMQTAN